MSVVFRTAVGHFCTIRDILEKTPRILGIFLILLCSFFPSSFSFSRLENYLFSQRILPRYAHFISEILRELYIRAWISTDREHLALREVLSYFATPYLDRLERFLLKKSHSSSAFSATLEIFLCPPFANTTDCMSPSRINIRCHRTPAMRNTDSEMRPHPSPNSLPGQRARPALQTQLLGGCLFPIHWSFVFHLLGVKSDLMASVGWERLAD